MFRNAKATNEDESADLTILTLKLVAMATSLEPSENGDQIGNLQSNTYHMVKIWWKSVLWILR